MNVPRGLFRKLAAAVLAGFCFASQPCLAADEPGAQQPRLATIITQYRTRYDLLFNLGGLAEFGIIMMLFFWSFKVAIAALDSQRAEDEDTATNEMSTRRDFS